MHHLCALIWRLLLSVKCSEVKQKIAYAHRILIVLPTSALDWWPALWTVYVRLKEAENGRCSTLFPRMNEKWTEGDAQKHKAQPGYIGLVLW